MTTWHDLTAGVVHPWLCDQFGHLNVRNYAHFFNEAMFPAYARTGLSYPKVIGHGGHGVAAITRTTFIQEVPLGGVVRLEGALVKSSDKTLTYLLRMLNEETGELHATLESLEVWFNPETRQSTRIPDALRPVIDAQLAGSGEVPDLPPIPREDPEITNWIELTSGVCFPWHLDQFGHMNVRWYAHFFDDGIFHIWSKLGTGYKAMAEVGVHTVTATTTTHYRQEVTEGDLFLIEGGVARKGTKSATFRMRMTNAETGVVHAYQDVVEVFFDPETRKSAPMPDFVADALDRAISG